MKNINKKMITPMRSRTRSDSRLESFIESMINTMSGMVIAYTVMQFALAPLLDIPISPGDNVIVTVVLTFVSITRSYFWRRFFVRGLHRRVHEWVINYRKSF